MTIGEGIGAFEDDMLALVLAQRLDVVENISEPNAREQGGRDCER